MLAAGLGKGQIALDDVLIRHFLARIGIDLEVLDAMAGLSIELIEGNLLRLRGGGIQGYRARDERQPQKAFPVGARGHKRKTP